MSYAAINHLLNHVSNPGFDTCKGIAHAFGYAPEDVLRKAGLLPPLPAEDEALAEIVSIARRLPPRYRRQAIPYLRYLEAEWRGRAYVPEAESLPESVDDGQGETPAPARQTEGVGAPPTLEAVADHFRRIADLFELLGREEDDGRSL